MHKPIGRANNPPPINMPNTHCVREKESDAIKLLKPKNEFMRKRIPLSKPGEIFLSLIV